MCSIQCELVQVPVHEQYQAEIALSQIADQYVEEDGAISLRR